MVRSLSAVKTVMSHIPVYLECRIVLALQSYLSHPEKYTTNLQQLLLNYVQLTDTYKETLQATTTTIDLGSGYVVLHFVC